MRSSESDRALICPSSLVRVKNEPRSEKADKAAAWGNLVHHWKETGDHSGNKTLIKKLAATSVDRAKLWPITEYSLGHEITFSIDINSLQLRIWSPERSKYPRDHWKSRHPRNRYLTGSIDFVSQSDRSGDWLPWVDDLKTGTWPVYAKKSLQLQSYALVPWILNDCDTDVWVSITQWPKYRLDCKPKRNWHLLRSADLARHVQKIRWAVENPQIAIPTEDGCRFCLCKPDCDEFKEFTTEDR